MTRPRLLDLYCGAGGSAAGYVRAGFEVTGVDVRPQPNYLKSGASAFHQGDALEYLARHGRDFDAVHASPPCQAYCTLGAKDGRHPDLIGPTREALAACGRPYAIENVPGSPLRMAVLVCGSAFGLGVRRHRLFEASVLLAGTECSHRKQGEVRAYYGRPGRIAWQAKPDRIQALDRPGRILWRGSVAEGVADMGIDWMTWDELRLAVPPAYTHHLGRQLLAATGGGAAGRREDAKRPAKGGAADQAGQHLCPTPPDAPCERCGRPCGGRLACEAEGGPYVCLGCYRGAKEG